MISTRVWRQVAKWLFPLVIAAVSLTGACAGLAVRPRLPWWMLTTDFGVVLSSLFSTSYCLARLIALWINR